MSNASNKDQTPNTFFCLQVGDPEAFSYCYITYRSALLKYAMRLVADRHAAEDLTSETFEILYKRKNSFASERHLLRYLGSVTKWKCQNYLRQKLVRKKIETRFDPGEKYAYIDVYENELGRFYLHKELVSAVDRLPPLKKKVVLLYFNDKKKTKYIASHLRVAEQTVRNQLTKAKTLMRKSLDLSLQSRYK